MVEWLKTLLVEGAPRAWDFAQNVGAPYADEAFVEEYSEALREAIDLLPDVMSFDEAQLEKGGRGILLTIAALIRAYHGGKPEINANYMVPEPPSESLLQKALFCRKDRKPTALGCFLVLRQWAKDSGTPAELILPVERPGGEDALLFGAPRAYREGRHDLVVDTTDYRLAQAHENEAVRRQIADYFREHASAIRSFVSIPIQT